MPSINKDIEISRVNMEEIFKSSSPEQAAAYLEAAATAIHDWFGIERQQQLADAMDAGSVEILQILFERRQ